MAVAPTLNARTPLARTLVNVQKGMLEMEELAAMLTNVHLILTTVTPTLFARTQLVHTRVHAGMDIMETESEGADVLTSMSALWVSTTVLSTLTV